MAELLPSWNTHDVGELRRFARTRLIVADLDGTLIPADLLKTVQALRSSLDHHRYRAMFTIATGRTLAGAQPLLTKLSLPKGTPLILYNGSVIIRSGTLRLLFRRTIPHDSLRNVVEVALNHEACALAYFYDEPWFVQQRRSCNEHVIGWGERPSLFREFNNMPVTWERAALSERTAEPSSILIDTRRVPDAVNSIQEHLREVNGISVTSSGASYLEIRPEGSNKAVALQFVANSYGFSSDEVLALGDNDNDAEMLRWAGIGISVAAASHGALAESNYVCRHGVFEGAVEVLRLVKHAKHYFYQPKSSRGVLNNDEPNRKMA